MNGAPAVSVVMINYNREEFVVEAIQSVRRQTFTDWELIVVENGSTDRSRERIAHGTTGDPQMRVLQVPERVPIPVAANMGIRAARGQYIARLDSDDAWLANRLAVQLDWMEQEKDIGICGAQCELINAAGVRIGEKWFPISHADCVKAFWVRNPFSQSAVLIRQRCFDECGHYDESFEVGEDLELWMRVAQRFHLRNLPAMLVRERHWGQSVRMRQYRAMIDATLRARLLARGSYGHRMGSSDWLAFGATWCARWCPPLCARWLFYNVVLRLDRRRCVERQTHSNRMLSDPNIEPHVRAVGFD